ncbi:hypothetical protein SAMN04515674_101536 [Pseudarcicella hirudinis]|uniref:Phage integrase SAM-like domain-containing protein n=1 Tax=Pseudarcicella hirudinis TaxID=1079859 RepID=A0A1I5N084_9BACT|nr:phage integrase SAM-like domain-containing protein [Pseudarcicella hirudinis]SFP15218.1 hypothetical protein SAMN04515674_101536 [Pseudarcicella hirudinis]
MKNLIEHQMKITFYFRQSQTTSKKRKGLGIIYYYVMIDGIKSVEKSTKISTAFLHWDSINQELISGEGFEAKNRRLRAIRREIEDQKRDFELNGLVINEKTIFNKISTTKSEETLLKVVEDYLAEQKTKIRKEEELKHKGNIESSTYETYIKRIKNLTKFLLFQKKLSIRIDQVDERFCEQFDLYLTSNINDEGKSRGQNYATKHIKLIRTIVDFARRCKLTRDNPTIFYKLKHEGRKKVKTVSPTEVSAIEKLELNWNEQRYLDVFIFCRECIIHHGDFKQLCDEKHLRTDENGNFWIIKPRKKAIEEGRQIQIIPMSDKAIRIMLKYGSLQEMPRFSTTNFNRYLKMLFAKAKVNKNVSSKMGRSSGISEAYNVKKLRGESIAVIAGWTTTRELESYLEIDHTILRDEYLSTKGFLA